MAHDLAGNIRAETNTPVMADSREGIVSGLSLDDRRLEPFVLNHPNALIFHHPAYLRTLEEESQQQCLVLASQDRDGRLEAILPFLYTRGLPFNIGSHQTKRRLCSLPRTPMSSVLSDSPAATARILDEAVRIASLSPGLQLQIKTRDVLPSSPAGMVATKWRPTYVLDLPESGDWLQLRNARDRHNIKWAVNKARKLGIMVREAQTEDDLRAWYQLYLCTMQRNVVLPRSYRYFRAAWRNLRPRGLMHFLLAETKDATLVAGSIFLMAGSTVFYAFTGCFTEYVTTHANDLILWHAIESASWQGYRHVDFGEVAEDHQQLARYKRKWGCEPRPLYRYYFPNTPPPRREIGSGILDSVVRRAWQALPLPLTSRVGEWIYHYL